jgi:hypothetical protein
LTAMVKIPIRCAMAHENELHVGIRAA